MHFFVLATLCLNLLPKSVEFEYCESDCASQLVVIWLLGCVFCVTSTLRSHCNVIFGGLSVINCQYSVINILSSYCTPILEIQYSITAWQDAVRCCDRMDDTSAEVWFVPNSFRKIASTATRAAYLDLALIFLPLRFKLRMRKTCLSIYILHTWWLWMPPASSSNHYIRNSWVLSEVHKPVCIPGAIDFWS